MLNTSATPAVPVRLYAEWPHPAGLHRWETALANRTTEITTGRPRSWDLCADLYLPLWDELADAPHELVMLCCHFVETLTAEHATEDERRMIALGVKMHGKIFLAALNEAIGATDDWCIKAWFRYARAVCQRRLAQREPTT